MSKIQPNYGVSPFTTLETGLCYTAYEMSVILMQEQFYIHLYMTVNIASNTEESLWFPSKCKTDSVVQKLQIFGT